MILDLLDALLILIICCILSLESTSQGPWALNAIKNVLGIGSANLQLGGGSKLNGWFRDGQCNYQLMKVLKTFVKANNLNQTTTDNWSVYLPCGYNHAETEYSKIVSKDPKQKIFIIKGGDNLSRKDTLWKHLQNKYGEGASAYMPKSYILNDHRDIVKLNKDYNSSKVYILKKNIQRQQGLKMTQNKKELLQGSENGYVIAQEMLQDPFCIDGRKTNCRYYLLIMCQNGKKSGYLYNNGFMYYTPAPFKKGSMEEDRVITAGLSTKRRDAKFYETHPLTLQDWQKQQKVDLIGSVGVLMNKILSASSPHFCTPSQLDKRVTFQLFGCDIAFNEKMQPQLIEINKGPDLSSRSEREIALKDDLIQQIFSLVGLDVVDNKGKKIEPVNLKLIWE